MLCLLHCTPQFVCLLDRLSAGLSIVQDVQYLSGALEHMSWYAGVGWIIGLSWWVGAFLPIKRQPRFQSQSARVAWLLNVAMSLVLVAIIIAAAVVASRHKDSGSGEAFDFRDHPYGCSSSWSGTCYG